MYRKVKFNFIFKKSKWQRAIHFLTGLSENPVKYFNSSLVWKVLNAAGINRTWLEITEHIPELLSNTSKAKIYNNKQSKRTIRFPVKVYKVLRPRKRKH